MSLCARECVCVIIYVACVYSLILLYLFLSRCLIFFGFLYSRVKERKVSVAVGEWVALEADALAATLVGVPPTPAATGVEATAQDPTAMGDATTAVEKARVCS